MERTILLLVAATMLVPAASVAQGLVNEDPGPAAQLGPEADPSLQAGSAQDPDRVEAGLGDRAAGATDPLPLIVHFHDRADADAAASLYPTLDIRYTFDHLPAVVASTPPGLVAALGEDPRVAFVEAADKPLAFHLDTATVASRAKEVYDPSFEPPDPVIDEDDPDVFAPDGSIIDGSGVGVAVVDSGLDGTHPDFEVPGKQDGNYLVTPEGVVEAGAYTVQGDAHGTHLAGIAAGTGIASSDKGGADLRGAAPGATLTTFASWAPAVPGGPDATILLPAVAFDWILSHGADQDPPIRVVLNGWSCASLACRTLNADMAHVQLARELAEEGFVVVFPAGNGGGNGLQALTTGESRIATPGVLGVANHDDELGTRTDCIKASSSKGDAFDPATWPDLAAPGDVVWTTNALAPARDSRVPVAQQKAYVPITGTSASAAHIAGVAALLLQANGTLSPAEVEHILEVTAHKLPATAGSDCPLPYVRADPSNPWGTANYAAGHGLVDAMDAVQAALNFTGLPDPSTAPDLEPIPEDFPAIDPSVADVERVYYLRGDDDLRQDPPPAGPPTVRPGVANTLISHTSEPLKEGFNTSGVVVEAWVGTSSEWWISFAGKIVMRVERLPADGGPAELVGEDPDGVEHILPGEPMMREGVVVLDETVTFEPGDRIRVSVGMRHDKVTAPVFGNYVLYSDGRPTPTRVLFGERAEVYGAGSEASCYETSECALIGGHRELTGIDCNDDFPPFHVRWFGPPGSTATVDCYGAVASCTVPGAPGDAWGTCEAQSAGNSISTGRGVCSYTVPDGALAMGAKGRCATGPLPG